MHIKDIGGEFSLIERLAKQAPLTHPDLVAGIGDDAAVIGNAFPNGDYLLLTTDMLVEHSHFRRDWSSADEIGIKSVACNVSDIAAMGGRPTFMFVAIALPHDTAVEWADGLYRGMAGACRRYGVVLAGGDTTHGDHITISISLMGRVAPADLCLRRHARPGDLLCVSGAVGGAAAGLAMLAAGMAPPADLRQKHLAPDCRLDVAPLLAPRVGAMIDISDGLAAEVNHICDQSDTGAELVLTDIPIAPSVVEAATLTGRDPYEFALSGGDDYELLFSVTPQNRRQLEKQGVEVTAVGRVTDAAAGRWLRLADGRRVPLRGGYNHFNG